MRTQLMWLRALTATVLFILLSQANVWANTQAHMVLAVGYRAFLVVVPLFTYYGLGRGIRGALGLGVVSTLLCFISVNEIALGLFALSMAVTGYLTKFVTSQTTAGAADNKVALNLGSLASGGLLMVFASQQILLILSVVLLIIATLIAFKIDWESVLTPAPSKNTKQVQHHEPTYKWSFSKMSGWSLIGIATGIKLTGIFTILPQYLLLKLGALPPWFGTLIMINSLGVILVQHRVLHFLDQKDPRLTHWTALSALFLLALPALLKTEKVSLAILWVVLLTLGECALSRYDRTAKEAGYLFQKELMVGIGSFLTVMLSRHFPLQIHWSGLIGMVSLIGGLFLVSDIRVMAFRRSRITADR